MATAKKKPSAAQLRARAAFTRTMKSGGFGAAKKSKRKSATKRAKNPIARSGANDRAIQFSERADAERGLSRSRSRTQVIPAKVPETHRIYRMKNPVGRSGHSGQDVSTRIGPADFNRQTRSLSARKANPTHTPVRFCVYEARHGMAGKLLGAFPDMKLAKEYAQAWAHAHKCPAGIIGSRAR